MNDRKQTGAHYTDSALADVLAERLLAAASPPPPDAESERVRVLDPACGDGALLTALYDQLPTPSREHVVFEGLDTDAEAVETTQRHLEDRDARAGTLRAGDFLEWVARFAPHRQLSLLGEDDPEPPDERPDWIVANPPYVRTQVLGAERSQRLARLFGLSGRVDLYQAFLVGMISALEPGGTLAVLTSNRFMSTRGASDLRDHMRRHLEFQSLIDLGDTKLFDAGVLPAILVAHKPRESTRSALAPDHSTRIYERELEDEALDDSISEVDSTSELLHAETSGLRRLDDRVFDVRSGAPRIVDAPHRPWAIVTEDEADWLDRIESRATHTFGDLCEIHVGLKTNADEVFIRDDWEELLSRLQPEPELLHPLLSSRRATRWAPDENDGHRVLYPHRADEPGRRGTIDLESYPRTRRYLEQHRDRHEERQYLVESGRHWYEHWVPHQPHAWEAPKVVFPDISDEPIFFWDDRGRLVDGNCYWMTSRRHRDNRDVLYLLLGLANSETVARYHDRCFQNRLYAGRRRYITQYVEHYPVPDLDSEAARKIVELARSIVESVQKNEPVGELEAELNETVESAFGLR